MNEEEYQDKFVQEVEAKLRGEAKKTWSKLSPEVRQTGREILGCTSRKTGKKEET